jgi:hypothetical protein
MQSHIEYCNYSLSWSTVKVRFFCRSAKGECLCIFKIKILTVYIFFCIIKQTLLYNSIIQGISHDRSLSKAHDTNECNHILSTVIIFLAGKQSKSVFFSFYQGECLCVSKIYIDSPYIF